MGQGELGPEDPVSGRFDEAGYQVPAALHEGRVGVRPGLAVDREDDLGAAQRQAAGHSVVARGALADQPAVTQFVEVGGVEAVAGHSALLERGPGDGAVLGDGADQNPAAVAVGFAPHPQGIAVAGRHIPGDGALQPEDPLDMPFLGGQAVRRSTPAAVVVGPQLEAQALIRGMQHEVHGIPGAVPEAAQFGLRRVPLARQPLRHVRLDVPSQVLVFSWAG